MSSSFYKFIKNSIFYNKGRSILICISISISIALIMGVNILIASSNAAMESTGISKTNQTTLILYILSLVVGVVVIIFIYSIFKIFVMENTKIYGMLRAIGVRRSKLFSLVLFQGLAYGIISIPIGLFLGYFICKGFMILSDAFLMHDALNFPIVLSGSAAMISIVYGLASTLISVSYPAIIASCVSPVEAVSSFNNSRIGENEGYLPMIFNEFLSYKWKLAFSDIMKNKSKAAFIVIVFSISLILVTVLSAGFSYIDEFGKKSKVHMYDFEIGKANGFTEEYISELSSNSLVDSVNVIETALALFKTDKEKLNKNHLNYRFRYYEDNVAVLQTILVSYDDDLLDECKKYIVSGDIDIDTLENGIIAFVNEATFSPIYNTVCSGTLVDLKAGDKVSLDISDYNIKDTTYEGKIKAVINDLPYSPTMSYDTDVYFIVSNETFNEIAGKNTVTNLKVRLKSRSFEKEMEKFLKKEIDEERISSSFNLIDYRRSVRRDDEFVKYIFLFFTFMLFIVGVIINVNMIVGTITAKGKQFLIYKAIGIRQSNVNRIILIELMFYMVLSLIIGLVIGTPVSMLVFDKFVKVDAVKVYKFPYVDVGIYILAMTISTIIAYFISVRQMKKAIMT